jgi:hypothetical protein
MKNLSIIVFALCFLGGCFSSDKQSEEKNADSVTVESQLTAKIQPADVIQFPHVDLILGKYKGKFKPQPNPSEAFLQLRLRVSTKSTNDEQVNQGWQSILFLLFTEDQYYKKY